MKTRMSMTVALSLALVLNLSASDRSRKSRLTNKDKSTIIQIALTDAIERLKLNSKEPSILDNCRTLILGNDEVVFLSTRNIEPKTVSNIQGVHFEFMSSDEITKEVEANDRLCYFEFNGFEDVGSKVRVHLHKYLRRRVYIYGELLTYEFSKVSGKWKGVMTKRTWLES